MKANTSRNSALMPEAKVSLLRLLLKGESTAESLASRSQIHVSVTRRHLDELKARGLITTRSEREARGRPRIIYQLTIEGREIFYSKYGLLLEAILQSATQDRGLADTKKMMASAAETVAKQNGAPKKMDGTIQFLRETGFQPELRTEKNNQLVISKNCPVLRTATQFPELVCDTFHTVLLENMVGVHPIPLLQAISRGANECIHQIMRD
jgi:predicted ArsR family transcriptional regulator